MNNEIVSGSAIAVAVAASLVGGATPAAAGKYYHTSKAKTAKAPASPEKRRCNANGCPTK